jgi:hypothetical protein
MLIERELMSIDDPFVCTLLLSLHRLDGLPRVIIVQFFEVNRSTQPNNMTTVCDVSFIMKILYNELFKSNEYKYVSQEDRHRKQSIDTCAAFEREKYIVGLSYKVQKRKEKFILSFLLISL